MKISRTIRKFFGGKLSGIERERSAAKLLWTKGKGDLTYRLNYPLNRESVVVDIGGYLGQWTSDIYAKYRCHIHVFEPVPDFANFIANRFSQNPDIVVHRHALSDGNGNVELVLADDGTSAQRRSSGNRLIVPRRDICSVLDELGAAHIDLMKINIEGDEYLVLPRLIDSGWVNRITDLQIQFHTFAPDAERRRSELRTRLSRTHLLTYDYPFIWENWQLKS